MRAFMLFATVSPRAEVRTSFAPLIARAEAAGWAREVETLREVAAVGSELPSFWKDFVVVTTNVITTRRRIAKNLAAIDRETAERMVGVMRDLPGDISPHAGSLDTLLAYLDGTATLYTEAVALALRFGGCGAA